MTAPSGSETAAGGCGCCSRPNRIYIRNVSRATRTTLTSAERFFSSNTFSLLIRLGSTAHILAAEKLETRLI